MRNLLAIVTFTMAIGFFSSASFANELGGRENIANPFPVYTTING